MPSGPGDRLRHPVQPGHRDAFAVDKDHVDVPAGGEIDQHDAATDSDRPRRCSHRDGVLLLAEPAADKAKHTAGHVGGKLAGAGRWVVDELVDHHVGVRSDAQRRLIDEEDLGLTFRSGADALVKDDVLSEHQPPRRGARGDAGGLRVDRAADADTLLCDRRARQSHAEHERGERGSAQLVPDDPHC